MWLVIHHSFSAAKKYTFSSVVTAGWAWDYLSHINYPTFFYPTFPRISIYKIRLFGGDKNWEEQEGKGKVKDNN